MKIEDLLNKLLEIAPMELSEEMQRRGMHDNSGLLVRTHTDVKKALFTLDLSPEAVEAAVSCGADTVITHHPAIYYPVKDVDAFGETAAVALAVENKLNVISMHLNLDIAKTGVDQTLAETLGGKNIRMLHPVLGDCGYGRESEFAPMTLTAFVDTAKKNLSAVNAFVFGDGARTVKKVASFCGGGADEAMAYFGDADVVLTSDMPFHVVQSLVRRGKAVVLFSHYATEFCGIRRLYETVRPWLDAELFNDERYL